MLLQFYKMWWIIMTVVIDDFIEKSLKEKEAELRALDVRENSGGRRQGGFLVAYEIGVLTGEIKMLHDLIDYLWESEEK